MAAPANVDEYIATFPPDVQPVLQSVREAIHASVPDGEEKIRYGIAAVMLGGRYAIHFAGWKRRARGGGRAVPLEEGLGELPVLPPRAVRPDQPHVRRDRTTAPSGGVALVEERPAQPDAYRDPVPRLDTRRMRRRFSTIGCGRMGR
jgi:hypothetical protein